MALTSPAGRDDATITAVLGPTNTGKTHYAIERMLSRATGVIGLPLRLLAREVYDKVVALRGPGAAALITGEERIQPPTARYFICTVEAMPLDGLADFVAVDEIQLCADPDRGHIFTDRLLHARGRYETLFMGSDVIRPRIASLVPKARFLSRERFSSLAYAGSKKLSRLKERTAIVAFSVDQVYAIAELLRRQRGGAAVVMGALSPRTRNAQVALYQNGDVDYLVATDAIGMGLNLDVDHVAFAGVSKFDGHRHRSLLPNELGQIAGRAGRFTRDGTFGVTGEAQPFDEAVIEAIESHRFKPLERLMWRNSALEFGSVPRLIESLEQPPEHADLARAREAEDLATLRFLWNDPEIRDIAANPSRVRLLWDVCQIPDFRKVMPGDHAGLVSRIYRFLQSPAGAIPSDWIARQVKRIDRIDGDIDALSKRLAFVRTWTYVANRSGWVEEPEFWRETTRAVEDRLSDALHERLTQRFVDRRTSVLMRRLKQKERLVAEVNDKGEVTVEGEFVGRLHGFRFTADEAAEGAELRALRSASLAALQQEFARRADKLYLSPDSEIDVTEQGGLMWGTDAVGKLEKGDTPLAPRVRVFVDDIAEATVAEKVERRLSHWVQRRINALFEPMLAMQGDEAVTGLARGVAFRLGEAMGVVPRREMADDVKALGQDERAMLRKHGVRFGQHNIFIPALLKPAPTRMRLILWGLWQGLDEIPGAPPPGHVTLPADPKAEAGYYEKAGYRVCGNRAVRIDMLERLADMIRPMDARAGFEATPDMLSITGCTLEQFAEIMKGLGFQAERGERTKGARPVAPAAGEISATAAEGDAPASTGELEATAAGDAAADATGTETGASTEPEAAPETEAPGEVAAEATAHEATPDPVPLAAEVVGSEEPSAGEASSAEAPRPDELEVFYTFVLRPRQRPARGRRPAAPSGAQQQPVRGEREDGGENRGRRGGQGKPARGPKGGGEHGRSQETRARPEGERPDRKGKPQERPQDRPQKRPEKPVDPDSPFAILQQLKNK